MKVGFTGTRNGMTDAQKHSVRSLFDGWTSLDGAAHHGDCIGADADFHEIAKRNGFALIGHPGPDGEMRAHCDFNAERKAMNHFARNRNIVNETDVLVATPRLMQEEDRGGTWYTIRYARKVGKPRIIVWPNGAIGREP